MRIWTGILAFTSVLAVLTPARPNAQTIVVTNGIALIAPDNGIRPALQVPTPVMTPQSIVPNASMPNATPVITPQGIAPAISPGATNQFNVGIGRQGSGTGIGQQSTTAIGQQGNTAIGQQGVGTAIMPTNGIVIGQPEPFNPPPQVNRSVGAGIGQQNPQMSAIPGGPFTNSPAMVAPRPTPVVPAPTGRVGRR